MKNYSNIQELCIIGLVASIICIIAPFSIPIPLGVPMTLQTFIITLVAIIFGTKQSTVATLIYIALGSFGLPVFSNFTGGWQTLIGPTGGFILSFPVMACIISYASRLQTKNNCSCLLGVTVATAVNFICGIAIFCIVTESSILIGFTTCVVPFIPITIIKVCLAYLIGTKIRKRINNSRIVDR